MNILAQRQISGWDGVFWDGWGLLSQACNTRERYPTRNALGAPCTIKHPCCSLIISSSINLTNGKNYASDSRS